MAIPKTIDAEYAAGEGRAVDARAHVAGQLSEGIRGGRLTGSKAMVARRVSTLAAASRVGDNDALRAAAMELAEASALLAVSIDLRQTTA